MCRRGGMGRDLVKSDEMLKIQRGTVEGRTERTGKAEVDGERV